MINLKNLDTALEKQKNDNNFFDANFSVDLLNQIFIYSFNDTHNKKTISPADEAIAEAIRDIAGAITKSVVGLSHYSDLIDAPERDVLFEFTRGTELEKKLPKNINSLSEKQKEAVADDLKWNELEIQNIFKNKVMKNYHKVNTSILKDSRVLYQLKDLQLHLYNKNKTSMDINTIFGHLIKSKVIAQFVAEISARRTG